MKTVARRSWPGSSSSDARKSGTVIEEASMFEGFDPTEYEDEARERWGSTDAYQESARRTARYGETEWSEIRDESSEIVRGQVELMRAGAAADGAEARALAERHREHISRWFYPCSPQMHRGLGEMYIADERFTRTYEHEAPGLAQYFHDAIVAGADAAGSDERARVSR
jgi:MerR family transcriptional regulator, thiopeptide resistance regulator